MSCHGKKAKQKPAEFPAGIVMLQSGIAFTAHALFGQKPDEIHAAI